MKLLDGKKLADKILANIKKEIKNCHLKLRLAVILVGENMASKIFIKQKQKACKEVGIEFKLFNFSRKITSDRFKKEIKKIAKNPSNSGIIIQLPLPSHINTQEILDLIPFGKDVDVLSENGLERFSQRTLPIMPPTVGGISRMLKKYKIDIIGRNIVIVGAGRLVGYPLALWFLRQKSTVSVLNKYTKDFFSFIKKADILISGVGKPNLIRGNMVKKGVIIIDAGTSMKNGKLVGDVDFNNVSRKASYITPVPGGVGPMTVACLIENLIAINKKR